AGVRGMTVLYVSCRAESVFLDGPNLGALFLPASIPAAMSLQERGIPALVSSDFLGAADFHEIWQLVISKDWRAIQCGASLPPGDGPLLLSIFGYSLALTLAQLLMLERLFDRIHERHFVKEILVDDPVSSPEDIEVFGSGLGNPVYCEAAIAWA